jgi:hypothetical protein
MSHTLEKQSVAEGPTISPLAGKPAPRELLIDLRVCNGIITSASPT